MYEGHIKRAQYDNAPESQVLRHLRWTDLVARLAATRDLRAELSQREESGFSAFTTGLPECDGHDPDADRDAATDCKRRINQSASDHGKTGSVRGPSTAMDADHGIRE